MKKLILTSMLGFSLTSCQTYNPMQDYELKQPTTIHDVPTISSPYSESEVKRGKYLAELLACGVCHTDGALVGDVNLNRQFAGSNIGIAYTNPFKQKLPGVLYPANLTPDLETGIGSWSDDEIARLLKTGIDATGKKHMPVMPWPAYSKINDEDLRAIVAFLRSLKPITHEVPRAVSPGNKATAPYVHFGVYQSKRP